MGLAALLYRRSLRALHDSTQRRYFWASPSQIVTVVEGAGPGDTPDPDVATAIFALDDLAAPSGGETWNDARAGTDTHQAAGSPT